MKVTLTKTYAFSVCYSKGARMLGQNYRLRVTVDAIDEASEKDLDRRVHDSLISNIHTRDLADVPFLRDVQREDGALLHALSDRLGSVLKNHTLRQMILVRDERAETCLSFV